MPHIHKKIDFVVDIFVVNRDSVLLRMHDKYKIWLVPGGHIQLDEEPEEAAVREVQEEVGLEVELVGERGHVFANGEKTLLVPRFMNRHKISDTHEHISFVFFARSETREVHQGETEVSDEIRWFTKEELENQKYCINERIRFYAKAALDELGT
jgi:ADP-ribose pyrophosphatase YjhB (NUDIX family)